MGSLSAQVDFQDHFLNTINGKLSRTSETRHGINPSIGKPNLSVPVSTKEDVDIAVKAAKAAAKSWSKTPVDERRKALLAFIDAVEEHSENFAKLLTQENGKPFAAAKGEMFLAVHWMRTLTNLEMAEEVVEENEAKKVVIRHTPLGVSVAIVPWNFPVLLACGKIAPSLVTGNPMIVKPSPFTPYANLKLGELAQRFFPPGVLQVLSGDDNLGPWLTAHPGPDKISFTGSMATGRKVMESASKTLKRVTLELGGNDPAIICDDVDIPSVAPKIAELIFRNSGQICLAIKRVYVHEKIYDEFLKALVESTKTMQVGDGFADETVLGPVQNSMQFDRVKEFFADIEKSNQKVVVGGQPENKPGYFIAPTLIDRPSDDSKIVIEEPFGPIAPVLSWHAEDEVIARANNSDAGLGASVWSKDLDRAARMAKQLEAGTVWVNAHQEMDPNLPYAGHKQSGLGNEWGLSGLKAYCNVQVLIFKKP